MVPLAGFCLTTEAGISYSAFADGGKVRDVASAGWSATATASGYLPSITAVTVAMDISGGYDGDLYA